MSAQTARCHNPAECEPLAALLSDRMDRIEDTLSRISESITVLIRVEERQQSLSERVRQGSEDNDRLVERVTALERAVGPLKETRKWIVGGILGLIGLIGVALASLVVRQP